MYFELSLKREVRYLGEEGVPRMVALPKVEISSKVAQYSASSLKAFFFFHLAVTNIYQRHYRYDGDWLFPESIVQGVRVGSSHAALAKTADRSIELGKQVHFLRSHSAAFSLFAPLPRIPATPATGSPHVGTGPHSWGLTSQAPAGLGPPRFTVASPRRLADSW